MYGGAYIGGGAYVGTGSRGGGYVNSSLKCYGAILALLAAASLSLGIANVVMTKEAYCNPFTKDGPSWCSSTKEPYIWTWVASGIWGSFPIFLAGLFAMCASSNPMGWSRWFALFIVLSAVVFAPGMIVLSSIEVWRGSASEYNFYNLNDGVKQGNIQPSDGDNNPYVAKFALPLTIAILGGIEFLLAAWITLQLCCCGESLGLYLGDVSPVVVTEPVGREVYYSPRPQITNQVEVYRPATRYNPVGNGVMYGNFPSRANFGGFLGANAGLGANTGVRVNSGIYGGVNNAYRWS